MALKLPEGKPAVTLVGLSALIEDGQMAWLKAEAEARRYSVSEFLRELLTRVQDATKGQPA